MKTRVVLLAVLVAILAPLADKAAASNRDTTVQSCAGLRHKADRRVLVCVMQFPRSFSFNGTVKPGSHIIWKLTCTKEGTRVFAYMVG